MSERQVIEKSMRQNKSMITKQKYKYNQTNRIIESSMQAH